MMPMKSDSFNKVLKDAKYMHFYVAIRRENVDLLNEIAGDLGLSRGEVVSVILDDYLPDVKLQFQAIKEVDGR